MANLAVTFGTVTVWREELLVDDSINSRQVIDEAGTKKLAESIKTTGLIHKPLVMRVSQLAHEDVKKLGRDADPSEKRFILVAGFRRQAALDLLQVAEQEYSLAPASWTLADALAANLTENLGRQDLSTYEIAMQCRHLSDDFGLTGAEIAKKIRTDTGDPEDDHGKTFNQNYVNNLIRCTRELPPAILDAWKAKHPAASMRTLYKLAGMETTEEQMRLWNSIVNPDAVEPEGEDMDSGEEGEEGEEEEKPAKAARPGLASIHAMIAVVQADETKDADWKTGALQALRWAAGVTKTVGGLKADKPKGKPKKAEEEAE